MDYKKIIQERQINFLIVFLIIFGALAINPADRFDWFLEHILTITFLVVLILTRNVFMLSTLSYSLIFIFLCLHSVGAYFTYSLVPFDFITNTFGFKEIILIE